MRASTGGGGEDGPHLRRSRLRGARGRAGGVRGGPPPSSSFLCGLRRCRLRLPRRLGAHADDGGLPERGPILGGGRLPASGSASRRRPLSRRRTTLVFWALALRGEYRWVAMTSPTIIEAPRSSSSWAPTTDALAVPTPMHWPRGRPRRLQTRRGGGSISLERRYGSQRSVSVVELVGPVEEGLLGLRARTTSRQRGRGLRVMARGGGQGVGAGRKAATGAMKMQAGPKPRPIVPRPIVPRCSADGTSANGTRPMVPRAMVPQTMVPRISANGTSADRGRHHRTEQTYENK